ncbi:MAG TPA: zf-HC2 domain-containing protein [Gemmatimonadaceae bacterium]|nr:zf-HC2 domain-containing protein [Gemmatimonadaceae bacterium]
MSHPHDALLQAHLDGELEPAEMREVTRHLSTCDACREASTELADLSYRLSEMIGRVDVAEPAEWRAGTQRHRSPAVATLDDGSQRRAHTPRVLHGAGSVRELPRSVHERPARARTLAAWRWAAAALLTVTSVAAAAVVRGPLFHGSRPEPVATTPASAAAPSPTLQPAGAIAIAPARGTMDVVLDGAAAGSRLHVSIGAGAELTVSVRSDSTNAEPARFSTGDARIAVRLPSAASLVEVDVPAAARSARILMGNTVVATVQDGRVTPAAAAAEGIVLGTRP